MRTILIMTMVVILTGCATQRYGRQTLLSPTERQMFDCKDIAIEIAKSEEFLSSIRMQRMETSGAHVLGALGDFGIGNSMEGDAAELSGEQRLKELRALKVEKKCP